jgi:DHA3 family macrolide efflux protein-like MFS transporter
MNFLRLLRHRHLALLWIGQVFSAIGDYLYEIAVVWTAVQVAGGRAGIVIGAGTVARFVCGLFGGAFADRWDRRRTMIVTVPLFLSQSGHLALWHLAVVAILISAMGTLFDPALQASLPALVREPKDLYALNGLMDGTSRLARALGPSGAGLLLLILPLPQFFTLNAISFLISAGTVTAIGRQFAWRTATTSGIGAIRRGVLREIGEALTLVRGHRALASGIAANALSNLGWSAAFTVGVPLLADRVLGGGVGAYGTIVGAYGVGNIVSNVVIGSMTLRRPLLMLHLGRVVLGLGFLIVAFAPTVAVAVIGSALAAVGGPMGDIVLLTMMQRDLPPGQIGKVYALRLATSTLFMSVGLILAGPLFATLPVPKIGRGRGRSPRRWRRRELAAEAAPRGPAATKPTTVG